MRASITRSQKKKAVLGLSGLLLIAAFFFGMTISVRGQGARSAPPSASMLTGEVQIEADLFGVGGVVQPGDLAGIRLLLTDRGDRVRDTIVRLHLRDPDGDEALVQRSVTLNPGRPQTLWLYARLPSDFDRMSLLSITIHETVASNGRGEVGKQIAAGQIAPTRVVPITDGLIGVVGRQSAGLEKYTVRDDSRVATPTTHELIDVIAGIAPVDMPDTWMGWSAFEALVWIDGDPTELRTDQAQALRQWIARGGRLIVVLPGVGQIWTTNSNPLLDMMPAMVVSRRDGVNLNAYRRLLTSSDALPLPERSVVHVFEPSPFAGPEDAIPILAGPDGGAVVMRRLIGAGDVTIIGMDLGAADLTGRIDPQIIWHRILGKRFEVRTRTEITDRLKSRSFPRPSTTMIDEGIAGLINKTGSAGVGVLLGLIVFAAYFLLAGPIGFGVLTRAGYRRHAWIAFITVAAGFTLIAWGGASIIRPRKTDITHLSFLDAVHGQDMVRIVSWFSVLLPTYGSQTVTINDTAAPMFGLGAPRNVLWPWQEPSPTERAPFPDRRSYVIDSTRPDTIRVPTRSTVKEFESLWAGPPPWRLPQPAQGVVTLDSNGSLVGSIVHHLPGAMEHVVVVLVRGQQPLVDLGQGGPLLARVWAWSPFGSQEWAPGRPLDLTQLDYRDADSGEEFFRALTRSAEGSTRPFAVEDRPDLTRSQAMLDAVTWYSALEPPKWTTASFQRKILTRQSTHGWDLGRWMTEPCLIVVGQLSRSEIPTPVAVDGVTPPSTGRTIIRWVYPLPADPPRPTRNGAL